MQSFTIGNIRNYPTNGNHLEIFPAYPIPLRITNGEDPWFYYKHGTGEEIEIKAHLWYPYPISDTEAFKFNLAFKNFFYAKFGVRGFRKPELALKYAVRTYRAWLREETAHITEFQREIREQ